MRRGLNLSKFRNATLSLCICSFVISSLAVWPFVKIPIAVQQQAPDAIRLIPWVITSLLLACLMAIIASLTDSPRSRVWAPYLLPVSALLLGIARALEIPESARLKQYGDAGALEILITDSDLDFGRWLLGLTLLRNIFEGMNVFLFSIDAEIFVRITGALLMSLFGFWFLSKSAHSTAPWLLTVSPVWVLFAVGYSEYYPFIAGVVAVTIWQILSNNHTFSTRSSYMLAGLLPVVYIGAAPISVALVLHTWSRETIRQERIRGLALSVLSFIVAIEVGGEVTEYVGSLETTMGLGEEGTGWAFFSDASLVFTQSRILDIWFWISCATGLACFMLPAVLPRISKLSNRPDTRIVPARRIQFVLHVTSRVTLIIAATVFLLFMNPLLGPTLDIDLYFICYFTLLFLLAHRLDLIVVRSSDKAATKRRIMQVLGFGFAPATTALVLFGVTR